MWATLAFRVFTESQCFNVVALRKGVACGNPVRPGEAIGIGVLGCAPVHPVDIVFLQSQSPPNDPGVFWPVHEMKEGFVVTYYLESPT